MSHEAKKKQHVCASSDPTTTTVSYLHEWQLECKRMAAACMAATCMAAAFIGIHSYAFTQMAAALHALHHCIACSCHLHACSNGMMYCIILIEYSSNVNISGVTGSF